MYRIGSIISKNIYTFILHVIFLNIFSYAISYDAERSRNVSHQVRQDGRRLINETYNESWWNKHDKYVEGVCMDEKLISLVYLVMYESPIDLMKLINGVKHLNIPFKMLIEKFKRYNQQKNSVNDILNICEVH